VVQKLSCKYRLFFQILCLLVYLPLQAQVEIVPNDPNSPPLNTVLDTIAPDSSVIFKDSSVVTLKKIKISNDGLDEEVSYGAKDSMWFNVVRKQVHLFGQATVKYGTLSINAGYILLDYEKSEITAEQFPDSSGTLAGLPQFKDPTQDVTANKLRYNFKTKKGIIYEARTQQDDLYVLGEKAKIIGNTSTDTTNARAKTTIYNQRALITTCDDPHPHFGIRTQKLKVIPDKLVVTGLSNVEIMGIPTPLILPFGFYPITKTRKAGLIIPKDFEFADQEGLGLRDFGWYQPINDHMDVTALFNLYASGSYGARLTTRYEERYRFSSNLRLSFNNRVSEDKFAKRVSAKSFGIALQHNQDPKAHPTRKFGGSVNIETNRDQNRNRNDYNSVYQNSLSSNLNFSKSFPGKPYQFNASMSHSQNTRTRTMNISLPNATFTMQRIYPFKKKVPDGKEKWYEKVSLNYNSALRNDLVAIDTELFTIKTLQSARMGIQHRAGSDYNFKLFKYINIAPSVSLEENWYPYQIEKILKPETRLRYDTIRENDEIIGINLNESTSQYGIDTTIRHWGFYSYRQGTASISANTALFLTKQFKRGWFRGIRHTIKPSASIGFGPDFTKSRYDRFYRTVETDLRPTFNDTLRYSYLEEGVYGKPPGTRSSRDLILGYNLINVLEFKYFSAKKDTIFKKRIFDNLAFSGNYNFSADSLNWSPIMTGGLFRLFKGVVNLTWNATFDPYIADAKGRRTSQYVLNERGRLLRTTNLGFQVNTNCTFKQLLGLFNGETQAANGASTPPPTTAPTDKKTPITEAAFIDWFDEFRLSHRVTFERRLIATGYGTSRDTFIVGNHNVSVAGNLQLNSNWSLNISNIGYDLQSKQIVYPDLGFTRDLHCWLLSLSWQPIRGTYIFSLAVKPGTLDFLKIPYRKNNFDARL